MAQSAKQKLSQAKYYATHKAELSIRHAAWRATHKAETAARNAAYYAAHRTEEIARLREYRIIHKEEITAKTRAYYASHKAEKNASHAAYTIKIKTAAFNAYGGPKCACCGESLFEGLTIDHINGDGAKHRRTTGKKGGVGLYLWLRDNDYPPGFQVLCGTCNMAKGNGIHCPHQDARTLQG